MPAPTNDNFASATDLGSATSGAVTGTNVSATTEVAEPQTLNDGSYDPPIFSVWWKWTAPDDLTLGDWLATGSGSGNYQGGYFRLLRLTTAVDIPSDAIWAPMANPGDNRTDGTGFFLEMDLFVGYPGQFQRPDFGLATEPWDHNDRYTTWTGVASDGTPDPQSPGVLIPAGTDVWLIAIQWPDGTTTLPLDTAIGWDPIADTGSWTLADGVTPLVPWTAGDITEQQIGGKVGVYQFNTFGSRKTGGVDTLDTILDAWILVGTEWTFEEGNDDSGDSPDSDNPDSGGTTSQANFDVYGSQEYYLRVSSFDSSQSGPINLAWSRTDVPPVNDEITDAITIPTLSVSGTVHGDDTYATATETFAYTDIGHSLWWKYQPPADGSLNLNCFSSSGHRRLDIYTSSGSLVDTGASLTAVAGDGDDTAQANFDVDVLASQEYYIRVDAFHVGDLGAAYLNWDLTIPPPVNDNRADAIVLPTDSGSQAYITLGATYESDEPWGVDAMLNDLDSVWFSWSPTTTGTGHFTTDSHTFIEVFAILDGSDPAVKAWDALLPVGSGLGTLAAGIRADESYAIRCYPDNGDTPADGLTLDWSITAGGSTGGVGVSTGEIAMTLPVLVITSPEILNASIIDETPGESLVFTIDGDPTALTTDVVDADGTWDGGVALPELADGDHYLTATSGARFGSVGFTVTNDVVYFADAADPAAPTLPVVVADEWVSPL